MSQENVDRLRALLPAWNPGDEVDLSLLDPSVVYEDTILPDHVGETYRGYEGVLRATERWLEAYEKVTLELEYRAPPSRLRPRGDRFGSALALTARS